MFPRGMNWLGIRSRNVEALSRITGCHLCDRLSAWLIDSSSNGINIGLCSHLARIKQKIKRREEKKLESYRATDRLYVQQAVDRFPQPRSEPIQHPVLVQKTAVAHSSKATMRQYQHPTNQWPEGLAMTLVSTLAIAHGDGLGFS